MNTIRRQSPIILFVTFFVTLLAGCHGGDGDDPAAAAETLERALAPREVRLVRPEVREERPSVQLVGEVRAFDTVIVSSEVAGKVDRVLVEVGDRVAAGTPLAEVDRDTFRPRAQAGPALGRNDPAIRLRPGAGGLRSRHSAGGGRICLPGSRATQFGSQRYPRTGGRRHHPATGGGRPVGRDR